jgi:hypothetical protein
MYTPLYITQWYHAANSHAITIFEWRDLEHPVVRIPCTQRGVPFNICKVVGNINSGLEKMGVEAIWNAENDLDTHYTVAFERKVLVVFMLNG